MSDLTTLISDEFPVIGQCIHLNHAAVSPWPTRASNAVKAFADENTRVGSRNYLQWQAVEQRLRESAACLINASESDIGFVKNTSEGLSIVAHGMPWEAGDNVIISDEEFPSNRIVWESLERFGVEVRQVSLPCPGNAEQALINAADKRTRLLSISSVEYASGLKLDLVRLGELCRHHSIAFCVDAIQGLGAFTHDVQAANIDFLAADAHKWMLGPEGIGIFYCAPHWRDRLTLNQYGWHMVEDPFDFDKRYWQPATTARRFECGSPNMLGITAFDQSLQLLLEVGQSRIWQELKSRTETLFELVKASPHLELISCNSNDRYAGITVFRHRQQSAEELHRRLSAENVMCAMRGGGIRFAPHFYTPLDQLAQAVDIAAGE